MLPPIYNVCDNVPAGYVNTGITGCAANTSKTINSYNNGFAIATELELFAGRSDILVSGLNTLSSQIFFEGAINTAPADTYTLDFYANYDHILVLENGILTARF